MKILVVLFAVLAATAPIANDAPENFASIQTTSGKVVGHNARWPENSNVEEYLGIPYAASPVGSLRFKAPRPYKPKDDPTIKADDFVSGSNNPNELELTNIRQME
jgi:carboxylesterase type B